MRKSVLFLIMMSAAFFSCQKEFSFEPGTSGGGTGTGVTPTTPGSCLTCDYSPICDSSKFVYIDTTLGVASEVTFMYDVTADTTVNGITYKRIKETNSNQVSYLSCANNILRQYVAFGTGVGGTTVSNITQTALKSDEATGATWTDVINLGNGASAEYRYKIISKAGIRQVLDSTYTNIIYVRDTTFTIFAPIGEIPSGVRHSYWAKGIGLVEVRMEDLLSGSTGLIRKLKSYRR